MLIRQRRLWRRIGVRDTLLRLSIALAALVAVASLPLTAGAQSRVGAAPTAQRPLEIALVSAAQTLVPGDSAPFAIRLRPNPGWHTYWRYSGDVGSAPSVEWHLPAGFTATPLRWPTPEFISAPPLASYGYEREVRLPTTVRVPRTARVGSRVSLAATVSWVACKVECMAGDADVALVLPIAAVSKVDSLELRELAAEEARTPIAHSDWMFSAVADSAALTLSVRPPRRMRLPRSARYRFFVDSASVLDNAAPADVRAVPGVEDGVELRLRRSAYSTSLPTRLSGVLVVNVITAEPNSAGHIDTASTFAVDVSVPISSTREATAVLGQEIVTGSWRGLLVAALLALLGGTLLNLMPCVLPVLSIKAFGLVDAAAHDTRGARRNVLLFAAGVFASIWMLLGLLLVLRAAGTEVGWGYQLQSPQTVGIIALIVFAAALNMMGVFAFTAIGGSLGVASSRRSPALEAFLDGVLVTALATPCSAPFLATAIAYGITNGAGSAFVVFTALAFGLTWPVAAIALSPTMRRMVPRPGAWMITLRQFLSFPLLATVAWLAWVVGRQAGVDAMMMLLAALILVAFGLWIFGRFATVAASERTRRGAILTTLAVIVMALILVAGGSATSEQRTTTTDATLRRPDGAGLAWQEYSADTLRMLREQGRVVLLDFTADWCLTCKVNERVAFASDAVQTALREHNVALLRADWTTRSPAVTRALAAFGRNSIPLVALYPSDTTLGPTILPTLLTAGIVTRAVVTAATSPARPPVFDTQPH
jgi:thiol:disulfide interchange protein/DsbC/DsbD-like thiol-disulfide interchange protein